MTQQTNGKVTLGASEWVKIALFLLVQTIALLGVGIDMRERLRVVETRVQERDESFADLREEIVDLRKEIARARVP